MNPFLALIEPTFVLFCIVGTGAGILYLISSHQTIRILYGMEFLAVSAALGMLLFSQLLIYTSIQGLFSSGLILFLKILGLAGWALYLLNFTKHFSLKIHKYVDNSIYLLILMIFIGIMVLGSYASPVLLHGDARQYHLALPWLISITGKIYWNDTLLHGGTYLGYDILYLAVTDLSYIIKSPLEALEKLRLFNILSEVLLPISIFLLCKSFGASSSISTVASLALFSMGAIGYWGLLKNDIISAALSIIALVLLVRTNQSKCRLMLWLSTAIAAYAVTVKISNAVILILPFIYIYLCTGISGKDRLFGIFLGIIILIPWFFNAYLATGNPVAPIGGYQPDEIKQAWIFRNSNGIAPSFSNLISQFIPILLGYYPIRGNQSVGLIALATLPFSLLILICSFVKRKWSLVDVIAMSALLWFLLFYVIRYDNRFLSRYVLTCFSVLFAFVFARIEIVCYKLKNWPKIMNAKLFLFLVLFVVIYNRAVTDKYVQVVKIKNWGAIQMAKSDRVESIFAPYAYLADIRKPGDVVAINDHMLLFLPPPFTNLHAMHAVNLNLYRKDLNFLKHYLQQHNVKYFLFRKDISGNSKVVSEYIDRCTNELKDFGSTKLYIAKNYCTN